MTLSFLVLCIGVLEETLLRRDLEYLNICMIPLQLVRYKPNAHHKLKQEQIKIKEKWGQL